MNMKKVALLTRTRTAHAAECLDQSGPRQLRPVLVRRGQPQGPGSAGTCREKFWRESTACHNTGHPFYLQLITPPIPDLPCYIQRRSPGQCAIGHLQQVVRNMGHVVRKLPSESRARQRRQPAAVSGQLRVRACCVPATQDGGMLSPVVRSRRLQIALRRGN